MQDNKPRPFSKKTLIIASIVADTVDILLFTGAIPGPWSLLTEVPLSVMHFVYAGPLGLIVLSEFIPFVGFLPIYTLAALLYRDPQRQAQIIDVTAISTRPIVLPPPPQQSPPE